MRKKTLHLGTLLLFIMLFFHKTAHPVEPFTTIALFGLLAKATAAVLAANILVKENVSKEGKEEEIKKLH